MLLGLFFCLEFYTTFKRTKLVRNWFQTAVFKVVFISLGFFTLNALNLEIVKEALKNMSYTLEAIVVHELFAQRTLFLCLKPLVNAIFAIYIPTFFALNRFVNETHTNGALEYVAGIDDF